MIRSIFCTIKCFGVYFIDRERRCIHPAHVRYLVDFLASTMQWTGHESNGVFFSGLDPRRRNRLLHPSNLGKVGWRWMNYCTEAVIFPNGLLFQSSFPSHLIITQYCRQPRADWSMASEYSEIMFSRTQFGTSVAYSVITVCV